MTRTLVTGGAGFIGSHLVDRLIADGGAVTVLDDFSIGTQANLSSASDTGNLRIVEGSILDPVAVAAAMEDCTVVFHLAVLNVRASLGQPLENHDVNATGTLNVLQAADKARVGRFVYCSSSEIYGNATNALLSERGIVPEPVTVYGAAKLAGEYYTKAFHQTYGLPAVVVRPFNSYGPREHDQGVAAEVIPRFVIRVLNDMPPVIFGDGSNGRDFTYVTDTARGLAAAATCDALIGREVNIAYGRMITVAEVADTVLRLCQRRDLSPQLSLPRPGDVEVLHADTTLAREVLNYKAEIDFETGMQKYLDWFAETYPDPSQLIEDDPVNWSLPE